MPTLPSWQPTIDELRTLSAEMVKLANNNLPLERIVVKEELASEIFKNNKYKQDQIPDIAAVSPGKNLLFSIALEIHSQSHYLISCARFQIKKLRCIESGIT